MQTPSKFLSITACLIGLTAVLSGTAQARVINHDAVAPFRQDLTDYQWKFQPMLRVVGGCVPFPAVNWGGDTSGGLRPTGLQNGGCGRSAGQVYARAADYNGECAVMYAWYFPKDLVILGQGHRHDWENIVVWLSSCSVNARVNAVSYSAHGGYSKRVGAGVPMDYSHPKVQYGSPTGILNNSLQPTNALGGWQPAIRWLGMTNAARNALTYTNFDKATVPFKDSTFWQNLNKARYR